jgi:hypothetical protein
MNIFYLDHDPVLAAQYQCNAHVVKMILETCQLLCTAHNVHGTYQPSWMIKPTHRGHPCALWARETGLNYTWLHLHGMALCEEYTYRYGKRHGLQYLMERLENPPTPIANINVRTPVPLCMPDIYKVECPVESYRLYYRNGKHHLHAWKKRNTPFFCKDVAIVMLPINVG